MKAWNWAEANPNVMFKNNDAEQGSEGLAAGQQEVGPERLQKKILMSAVYMFKITGQRKYVRRVEAIYNDVNPITPWAAEGFEGDIAATLLYVSRIKGVSSSLKSRIRRDYQNILTGENGLMAGVAEQRHAYAASVSYTHLTLPTICSV